MKAVALIFGLLSLQASALKINQFDVQHVGVYAYNPAYPGITVARATYVVPNDPPTRNDQKLAFWIGLQTEDSKTVLQPVLTWGAWANGASEGWNVSCWLAYIGKDKEVGHKASKYIRVAPGEKLNAFVELISWTGGIYTYRCGFQGYPDSQYVFEPKRLTRVLRMSTVEILLFSGLR
jgi:hypothetical protein